MRVRVLVGSIVLVLVGAGCSSSAKQATSVRATGAGIGVAGLDLTGPNGVTAIGSATQTVRADRAFVVVGRGDGGLTTIGGLTIGPGGAPVSVPSTTIAPTKEHDAIRAALRPLGIASEAIEFSLPDSSGGGGPVASGVVQVEVPVAKLPQIGTAVVSAIDKVVGTIGGQGLRFAVRDCTTALSTARDKAVADAHTRAQALASAAGVKLGDLASVSEQPAPAFPFSYLANGGQAVCGASAASVVVTSSNTPVAELDAKPEVELHESVLAAYALGASSARTIAAAGVGERSGPADAADIVIVPQFQSGSSDPSASSPTNKIDSAEVLGALASLGIAKTDVEVENAVSLSSFSSPPSSSYVRVHVTVAKLKAIGAKIVDAVKAIVGTDSTSGVLFSASNCDNLLARARADAIADAGKRIDKLARAANVHSGAIVGVAELRGIVSLPDIDPCCPDVSSLSSSGLLSGLSYVSGSGLPSLVGLDATPKVTEQVSLSVNRAMSS